MKAFLLATSSAFLLYSSASAITISLDFSHSTNSFFDTSTADGQKARAAVQKAAADISAAITTQLNAVSSPNLSYTGSNGSANTSFTGTLYYTNPDTGAQEALTSLNLAQDEFKIYVGARSLGGNTLGQGGPGYAGYAGGGGNGSPDDFGGAIIDAQNNFNSAMQRGSDIIVTSYDGNSPYSNPDQPYTLNFAPTIGNLWFDSDGSTTWHLDHTTNVGSGKADLYSVALHEILHSLGVGIYQSWKDQTNGTSWTGEEVIALRGNGNNLIDGGDSHIASGVESKRLSDGSTQEVVMSPSIMLGSRKELTELDLAFLRDLGWTTVPEPTSMTLLGIGSFALILRRKRLAHC